MPLQKLFAATVFIAAGIVGASAADLPNVKGPAAAPASPAPFFLVNDNTISLSYQFTATDPGYFDARGSNLRFEYQGIADLGLVKTTFGAEHQQEKLRTLDAYFLPAGTPAFLSKEKANLDSVYLDAHAEPFRRSASTEVPDDGS